MNSYQRNNMQPLSPIENIKNDNYQLRNPSFSDNYIYSPMVSNNEYKLEAATTPQHARIQNDFKIKSDSSLNLLSEPSESKTNLKMYLHNFDH